MSLLDNLEAFLKQKAEEVVAELLEKNDHATLAHHALQVEASFAPAIEVLLPELQKQHEEKRVAMEVALRARYYDERLSKLREHSKQLSEKKEKAIRDDSRLQQALEENQLMATYTPGMVPEHEI